VEGQIRALRESLELDDAELARAIEQETRKRERLKADTLRMGKSRHTFALPAERSGSGGARARKKR
jgi:hypothetical protein